MKTINITIDVEPDACLRSWSTSNPLTFDGIFKGVQRIEKVAHSFAAPVTYFIQPVVLYDKDCVEFLKTVKGELATHLHGDYIPPQAKYPGPDFSGCDPGERQKDYAPNIEMGKMENLTNLFYEQFGFAPKSFRAGRFGASSNTFKCLKALKYTHDSSVVPGHKHFKKIKTRIPYRRGDIIEVPVTVNKSKQWLRPTKGYSGVKTMKKILREFDSNVCCMFHNVEVVPGISPYCDTEAECQQMLDRFARMLDAALSMGFNPIPVRQVKI